MRYLPIILFLASSALGQSFGVSGGGRSFIVAGNTQPAAGPVKPVEILTPIVELPDVPSPPAEVATQPKIQPPNRYIMWPGWGRIDLQTYNRNCNCRMCQSIRYKQQEYRRQLQVYQSVISKHVYEPESIVASQQATPDAVVKQVVDALALTKDDILADLGCGDGRILIAAVQRYGCKGIGIEIDPVIVETARRRVADAGLSGRIAIITGDAVTFDPSSHSVTAITAYLYPELLAKLLPVFQQESIKVVACPYHEVPGLAMVKTGDVYVYRRPSQAVPVAMASNPEGYTAEGVCRITAGNSHWSGVVIGPGKILTCAHHKSKGPFKAEFRRGAGLDYVSVTCELVKSNEAMDLSLLKFDTKETVKPRIYKLRKAAPNRIWGFLHGTTPKTFKVTPGATNYSMEGRDIIDMTGEGITSPQHGMSGSPVFADWDVVAIQFGGNGSSINAVSYDTIQEFLKETTPEVAMIPEGIDADYYCVCFVAPWCQPCQTFKRSTAFARIKERFAMTVVDVDDAPQWKKHVKSLPTVWLVRRSDRKMLRSWVGAVEVDSLLTAVAAIRKEAATKTPAVMQRTQAEHAAAKHLIDVHGINADGMTMSEMEAAHDAAHGGSEYHFPGMKSQ